MKTNQNDLGYEVKFREGSNHKSDNDTNKLESDELNMMQVWFEEEDEISDYTLMKIAMDQGYIG